MKIIISLLLVLALSSCALSPLGNTAGGGAAYKFERTETGCVLEISSSRDITDGEISVGPDCSLTTSIAKGDGSFKAISALVDRIPVP